MAKPDREKYADSDIESSYVGEPPELNATVTLRDYDPGWPALYEREAERIRTALGDRVIRLEHVGSTSVPGLCAKPCIDILLVVADSGDEAEYLPRLEVGGYRLVIREPDWEKHRCLKGPDTNVNLHVLSPDSGEIARYLTFRDRLRANESDRRLYDTTKRELAARTWRYIQNYADAKSEVVDEILARARAEPDGYDAFAAAYAEQAATSPFNALYDRPAILELAGDVAGKRVLDIGCAAGHLSELLAAKGATVTGVDVSAELIAHARAARGDRVEFRRADLARPLDFLGDATMDVVTASLVLHYLEDWGPTLGELWRVLRLGGALVLSVHHPDDWRWFGSADYFRTERVTDEWNIAGKATEVQFYRRPLSATFGAVRDAGFTVDRLVEPMPLERCRESDPGVFELLSTKPRFLYLRARKP